MTSKAFRQFFICFLLGLFLTAALGFYIVDTMSLQREPVAKIDYRNMLLEKVPSPRLVIDSGSNSYWSIVPKILEDEFHIPTFVIAENGSVPFDMKLNRLRKYTKSGDIVLLPLEWLYYSRTEYNSDFIESVFGVKRADDTNHNILYNYTYHYYLLPLLARLNFIFKHSNPNYIVRAIYERHLEPSEQQQISIRTNGLLYNFFKNVAGDVKNDANRIRDRSLFAQGCHQYLNATPLSDLSQIKEITNKLSILQNERNIKIVITWPAVAGSNCYVPGEVNLLQEQIKYQSIKSGLTVVGNPFDSLFSENHILDTYYHIDSDAAVLRTTRLKEKLRDLAVFKNFNKSSNDINFYAQQALDEKILEIENIAGENIHPIRTGTYSLSNSNFLEFYYFSPLQWYENEGWGRWSKGEKSRIILRSSNTDCQIELKGNNFAGSYSEMFTSDFKDHYLTPFTGIKIPKNKGTISLDIYNKNITSPKAINISEDNRLLGFGLEGINVICE